MPEVSWTEFPQNGYSPIFGVNSEDNEVYISDNEVQSASNFLFEKKQATTRPGLTTAAITGMSGLFIQAAKSLLVQNTYVTLMLTTTNRLFFVLDGNLAATEATGPGFTALNYAGATQLNSFFNPISIQGQVLFPGFAGPPIWTLAANTYTLLTSATTFNPSYMTSSFARAVAGYTNQTNGQQIVEYSKPGDVTTWNTAGGTDGSGNSTLTDIPDAITGMESIHNIVAILRPSGVHLGQPTGNALIPFRFEPFIRDHPGCVYPATEAFYNNTIYFVGLDDVYTYDLQQMVPIGYQIRTQLFNQLTNGILYRGFVAPRTMAAALSASPRLRYYLLPAGSAPAGTPVFIYDIKDRVWSIHSYSQVIAWPFIYAQSFIFQSPGFFDNNTPPTIFYWTGTQAPDQVSSFKSKTWRVNVSRDIVCRRVLLSHRDIQNGNTATVVVTGRKGKVATTGQDTQVVGKNSDNRWVRTWFNINVVLGNEFDITVNIPANQKFSIDLIQIELSESGVMKQ